MPGQIAAAGYWLGTVVKMLAPHVTQQKRTNIYKKDPTLYACG